MGCSRNRGTGRWGVRGGEMDLSTMERWGVAMVLVIQLEVLALSCGRVFMRTSVSLLIRTEFSLDWFLEFYC